MFTVCPVDTTSLELLLTFSLVVRRPSVYRFTSERMVPKLAASWRGMTTSPATGMPSWMCSVLATARPCEASAQVSDDHMPSSLCSPRKASDPSRMRAKTETRRSAVLRTVLKVSSSFQSTSTESHGELRMALQTSDACNEVCSTSQPYGTSRGQLRHGHAHQRRLRQGRCGAADPPPPRCSTPPAWQPAPWPAHPTAAYATDHTGWRRARRRPPCRKICRQCVGTASAHEHRHADSHPPSGGGSRTSASAAGAPARPARWSR